MKTTIETNVILSEKEICTLFGVAKCSTGYWKRLGAEGGYGVQEYSNSLDTTIIGARNIKEFLQGKINISSMPNVLKDNPVWTDELERSYEYHRPYGIIGEMYIRYDTETSNLTLSVRFDDID